MRFAGYWCRIPWNGRQRVVRSRRRGPCRSMSASGQSCYTIIVIMFLNPNIGHFYTYRSIGVKYREYICNLYRHACLGVWAAGWSWME